MPFFIHHKNRQPIFTQEKKFHRGGERAKQVENFSDESDDEFEQVKAEKKRGSKKPVAEIDPRFPASDPSYVKHIVAAPASSAKKTVAPVAKVNVEVAPQVEEKIVRPITGKKETVPVTKPKEETKAKEVENPWAVM